MAVSVFHGTQRLDTDLHIPYVFLTLQCVAGAMYITGFSESVAEVLGLQGQWAVRGMSAMVLLALLGINLAGVKWIVRLQLLLLAVLAVSTLDFVIGTFTHLDPGRAGGHGMVKSQIRTNVLCLLVLGGYFQVIIILKLFNPRNIVMSQLIKKLNNNLGI